MKKLNISMGSEYEKSILKNISDWERAAWAHGEYFSEIKPDCSFIEVK